MYGDGGSQHEDQQQFLANGQVLVPVSPKVAVAPNSSAEDVGQQDKWSCGERCGIYFGWFLFVALHLQLVMIIWSLADPPPGEFPFEDSSYTGFPYDYTNIPVLHWIFFVITVVVYVVEAWRTPFRRYVSNSMLSTPVAQYIASLHETPGALIWHIRCYHYETRTRTVTSTDANGNTTSRLETYQEAVTTHTAQAQFAYTTQRDVSEVFVIPQQSSLLRLRLSKTYAFENEQTHQIHDQEFSQFVFENDRDVHKTLTIEVHLDNFEDCILSMRDGGEPPFFLTSTGYWLAVGLGMTMPYRHWFLWATSPLDYEIVKSFGR